MRPEIVTAAEAIAAFVHPRSRNGLLYHKALPPAARMASSAMLQKSFMGQSLKASPAPLQPAQPQRTAPITQAFFKKAEKTAEKTAQKAASPVKGRATQVSRRGCPGRQ